MTEYVKINEGVKMHGTALESGKVYPVERREVGNSDNIHILNAHGMEYIFGASEYEIVDPNIGLIAEEGYYEIPEDEDSADEYEDDAYLDEVQKPGMWEAPNGLVGVKKNEPYKMTFTVVPDPLNPDNPSVNDLKKGIDIRDYITDFDAFKLDARQESEEDVVNSPSHYSAGMPDGIEVRDIIKAQGFWKEFCAGNVIKYSLRWQYKNGLEDLKKMLQYGQWLAEELEENDE